MPATIRPKKNQASSGLPSSTEAAPLTGKPKMFSHAETDLEQPSTSQISGTQSAPLTLGFSRMSRLKKKIMKAIVRNDAMIGGRWIPMVSEGRGQKSEVGSRKLEIESTTTINE